MLRINFHAKLLSIIFFLLSIEFAQAQTNVSGVISENTTWTRANSPYVLTGNILVSSGVTLVIEPGVTVKVNSGLYIKVEGILNAVGLSSSKIIFETNIVNPSDTSRNSWEGIQIRPTGGSLINNDLTYSSGTHLKFVVIKNARRGIYVYDTGLFVQNTEFINNNYGIELRSTNNILIDNSNFSNNNYGVYTEYESYGSDPTSNIQNTFIQNSSFISNVNGNYFFLNQREFKNLNINNNIYKQNQTGLVFSGGGYGCRVYSASIRYNSFIDNLSNGLEIGQIYGDGSGSELPEYPLVVEKNSFVRNSVLWNYGGGVSGVTIKFINNVISSPNTSGINIKGGTFKNDLFNNNYIYSNVSAINIDGIGTKPHNKTFSSNLITGKSSSSLVKTNGSGIVFTNNNFITFQPQTVLQIDDVNSINAINNYWGTTSLSSINEMVYDKNENFELGAASYTPILSSKNINAPISIPRNVVKSFSSGRITISWTANDESDIAGYKIYYGGYTGYSYSTSIDAGNVLTYTLPAGVNIDEDIAVTAYDANIDGVDDQFDGNESWYSEANKLPEAPSSLTVDAGPRKVKLSWAASSSAGIDGYNIYKSTDSISFSKIGLTSSLDYIDSTVLPNVKYFYKVTSFDSLDLSYNDGGLESQATEVLSAIPDRIIYVSPTGSNTNIGSRTSPKLTIQTTINSSLAGDTILLHRGRYNELVDLKGKVSLLSSMYIISGDTSDISNTILSGSTTGNNTLITNTGTPLVPSHHIYALTIQDVRLQVINLSTGNGTYFKLSKSIIKNSGSYGQWGVIAVGSDGVLDSCIITGNKGRYIIANGFNGFLDPVISNNTFFGNSSSAEGTSYEDNSVIHIERKSRVFNNLLYRNLTTAIDFGGNGSDSMIFINNTVVLNKGYGIRFQTWGGVYTGILLNNISRYNTQFDISSNSQLNGPAIYVKNNFFGLTGSTAGTGLNSVNNTIIDTSGNLGGDPYFVDTLNNDFRLKAQSRAIGAGSNHTYLIDTDIEGNPRINPWRLMPDMGAFESSYKFTSPLMSKTEPGNQKVELFWTQRPNTNIKAYKVYRSSSPIPDNDNSSFIADVNGVGTLSYIDQSPDLLNGTTFYYRLRAVHNDNSLSGLSNELTAIPDNVTVPTNFKLNYSPTSARLSWASVALNGAKYQIFRGTNINSKTLLVDSINAVTIDDPTLSRNTTYYYWIKTMNSTGALSEFSEPISLTPTNIWYVDSALGDDNLGIGSELAPYKKISKAVSNSVNLDSILINDGTYVENISYRDKQLSFIGINGATKVVLKPLLSSQIMAITNNGGKSLFKGLTFANGGNSAGSAIYTQTSNPVIENCIFRNNGTNMSGSILQLSRNNFIIKNCLVYDNSSNVFLDLSNGLDSIPYIYNLTYANNTNRWFYATGITSFPPTFINSIIWDASTIQYQGGLVFLKGCCLGQTRI